MIEFNDEIHSAIHQTGRSYRFIFGLIAVLSAVFLFYAQFDVKNFVEIGSFLLIFSSVFGIVALFKCLIVFIHKKCKTKKSTQIRNEILIGLGGFVTSRIVPRSLVVFVKSIEDCFFYSTFILCPITIALYYLFVHKRDNNYEGVFATNPTPELKLHFFLHIVTWIATIKIVSSCDFNTEIAMEIIFYVTYLGILCASMCDNLSELRKLNNVNKEEEPAGNTDNVRRESVGVPQKAEQLPSSERETCENQESQAAQTHPKIDCKVCRVEYSDNRVPRILNGCGHTICEVCVDALLNTNQSVICPFCKIATALKGPASTLQKNYGILEIINDLSH